LIALAAALLLAQGEPADCSQAPYGADLQTCEAKRREHDVLDDAKRPPAGALGADSIRFSTHPSLGGRGIIVEVVGNGGRATQARIMWFYGHPRFGWREDGSVRVNISAAAYRQLSAVVDHSLSSYVAEAAGEEGEEVIVLCTDGPGFLTERVRAGWVVTLTGSCGTGHPNIHIAAAMLSLACPYIRDEEPDDLRLQRNCRRWTDMARRDVQALRSSRDAGARLR
jgi:hypothetical protein